VAPETTEENILCPSSKCEEGAILLGIVQQDGHVGFVNQRLYINKEFVEVARTGRSPEKRFRFGNKCMSAACEQWSDGHCTVMERIMNVNGSVREPSCLPSCSIRPQCRWYQQHGGRACAICPFIITDSSPEGEEGGSDKQ
jgi:hypothetical protein